MWPGQVWPSKESKHLGEEWARQEDTQIWVTVIDQSASALNRPIVTTVHHACMDKLHKQDFTRTLNAKGNLYILYFCYSLN